MKHSRLQFMIVSSCQPAMPGTFSIDHNVGAQVHLFQLPQTPSSSTYLHASTNSLASHDEDGHPSRKRSRRSSYEACRTRDSDLGLSTGAIALETPGALSPAPFVNTRYTLAGGLDTPTTTFTSSTEYAVSPDVTARGGRGWQTNTRANSDSYFPQISRERNGRARLSRPPSNNWGKTIYNVFGVAGKAWEFCRANFRGFYAGGGPGYRMRPPNDDGSLWHSYNEKAQGLQRWERETSIPGGFPDEDFIPDYLAQDHTTPQRPAKRLQRQKGGDLNASWVMVSGAPVSRDTSPIRIAARKVPSKASPGRRPISKAGQRPILPASRPSLTSFAGSPALRSGYPASFAPSRSPIPSPKHESPVSTDVQRHAARLRKRELEEDANLKRFNQQLKAMIKEGKQALGTKIEVEDEFDSVVDEGYGE